MRGSRVSPCPCRHRDRCCISITLLVSGTKINNQILPYSRRLMGSTASSASPCANKVRRSEERRWGGLPPPPPPIDYRTPQLSRTEFIWLFLHFWSLFCESKFSVDYVVIAPDLIEPARAVLDYWETIYWLSNWLVCEIPCPLDHGG